jgi:hypothetical protein
VTRAACKQQATAQGPFPRATSIAGLIMVESVKVTCLKKVLAHIPYVTTLRPGFSGGAE